MCLVYTRYAHAVKNYLHRIFKKSYTVYMGQKFVRDPITQAIYNEVIDGLCSGELSINDVINQWYDGDQSKAETVKKWRTREKKKRQGTENKDSKDTELEKGTASTDTLTVPEIVEPVPQASVTVPTETGTEKSKPLSVLRIKDLQAQGIETIARDIANLEKGTGGSFSNDLQRISGIEQAIDTVLVQTKGGMIAPKDIDSLVRALSRLLETKRAALLQPYGYTAPPKIETKQHLSQHLHLHNHASANAAPIPKA